MQRRAPTDSHKRQSVQSTRNIPDIQLRCYLESITTSDSSESCRLVILRGPRFLVGMASSYGNGQASLLRGNVAWLGRRRWQPFGFVRQISSETAGCIAALREQAEILRVGLVTAADHFDMGRI